MPNDLKKKAGHESSKHPEVVEGSLKATMESFERRILTHTLRTHKSTYKTAEALGVNQSTIVRKMRRLGIFLKK